MSAPAAALPELAGDLWRLAQNTAGGRGFQFSEPSARLLQDLIKDGVVRLMRDDAMENTTAVAESKNSIVRLVQKIIESEIQEQRREAKKAIEATSTNMLREKSFAAARNWFCPCYPFC